MRQQYHFRESPDGLMAWDVFRLIALSKEFEIVEILLSDIRELDEEFWYIFGEGKPTCRNIIDHANLINNADLSYPIILCSEGGVMDGMHRVCRAVLNGKQTINAVVFSEFIKPDFIGVAPSDLPY